MRGGMFMLKDLFTQGDLCSVTHTTPPKLSACFITAAVAWRILCKININIPHSTPDSLVGRSK